VIKFTVNSVDDIPPIQKWIFDEGILINKFNKFEHNLEEVYNKLIIKGSVDTMTENIQKKKKEQPQIEEDA
jgi:hypothetical protein